MSAPIILPGNIEFNPHGMVRYKIDGIPVPGTTTITGMLPKEALIPWAAKMTAQYLEDKWLAGRAYAAEEIASLLKDAKNAHRVKKDAAANKGTAAHAWFESYVKLRIADPKSKEIPALPIDPDVLNSVQLFLRFVSTKDITWLRSEVTVASRRYMFGGRFDAIIKMDGKIFLVDFKTSSGLYYEYYVQAAAYVIACEDMGFDVKHRLLLWMPKTGKKFEAHEVPTPMQVDQECFLAALKMYHCIQDAEKIMKQQKAAA